MRKKFNKKFITMLLVCCFVVSQIGIVAYASSGWTAVYDKTFHGTRVVVSEPHVGWCYPDKVVDMHVNLIIYVNGSEIRNWHISKRKTKTGRICVRAYDTIKKDSFQFGKCHDDIDEAVNQILKSSNTHSLASDLEDYDVSWVVIGGILASLAKALVAVLEELPAIII